MMSYIVMFLRGVNVFAVSFKDSYRIHNITPLPEQSLTLKMIAISDFDIGPILDDRLK